MPFNKDYQGHYRVDRNMLVNIKPWSDRDGDALWRTAIGYICYAEFSLWVGMNDCFVPYKGYDQALRFPYDQHTEPELYAWAKDTVSRDQVCMAIAASRWGHTNIMELEPNLRWRLSKKHSMTLDMWLWVNKHYKSWLALIILQFLFIVPWNKLWRPIYRKAGTGWAGKLIYPHYSLFITTFMLAIVPDQPLARLARKLIRQDVEDSNYVLRILLHDWPSLFDMLAYEATSFRWNRRLDEPSNVYEPVDRKLEYNNIDIDLLYAVIKWGYKNLPTKLVQEGEIT